MARFIQGMVTKHNLMKQPMVVVNKSGGAGGEGFLYVKDNKGDPHKIIITLSNLFTTPARNRCCWSTGKTLPRGDAGARRVCALGQRHDAPYKFAGDYLAAVKAGKDHQFKMAGTGSKQEDQIITVALDKLTGKKFTHKAVQGRR